MKKTFIFMIGFLMLFLVGCGTSDSEIPTTALVQNTLYENNESDSSIDDMLTESYPWRKAYAEFLWDREQLNEEFERQFTNLTSDNYEYYNLNYYPEIGFIFLDSDDIPELLVYYNNKYPPGREYYVIYHYVPANKESSGSVKVYYSGSSGIGAITWKYLPHGNAFYTGYTKCMGGFYGYDLFFLDNGDWINWDDVPVITSRIIAEHYGIFDGESINIHSVEPMFSDEWRSPELNDVWMSLYHGAERYFKIEKMFGTDAVAGLPTDTD